MAASDAQRLLATQTKGKHDSAAHSLRGPMSETLPVERFSPAPGLWIDRNSTSTAITGDMEFFGPEANSARAQSVMHHINRTWTATFADGYRVSCSVSVRFRTESVQAGRVAQIEAAKIPGPSHVDMSNRAMTLNANETNAFTWTAAHEFGHVIGLQDRYSEGIVSRILGQYGGTRTTTVDPRYASNLMAVQGGVLESQNLRDLAGENAPGWLDDDDRVLAWITHHELGAITALSTTQKLAMLGTLASGWIATEELSGIVRICSSVRDPRQANAIRSGFDLRALTDLSQRTTVRLAFARMP
jgi:hypothetical protein